MARIRWAVRCTAHRRDGERCRRASARGSFVCFVHGGAAPQVRAMAQYRLSAVRLLDRDAPGWRDDPERWRYLLTPGRSWHGPRPV
jgi:hypothetical protein